MSGSPVPPGWSDNADTLDEFVTLVGPGTGGTIYWNELVDKVSHSTQRWSSSQSSAAEMIFATLAESVAEQNTAETIALSVLGGYNIYADNMVVPMQHPIMPALYATDLEIQPYALDNTGSDYNHRYALCKVGFQSLPYDVTGPQAWLEWMTHAANDRISTPVGFYQFTSGPDSTPTPQTAFLGSIYTSGTSYQELIAHQVWQDLALDDSGTQKSVLAPYCGNVNSDTSGIFSDTGKWLLDSVTTEAWGSLIGNTSDQGKTYNVHLHLIYHPNGWNKAIASDGSFQTVSAINGTGPPFPTTSFSDLLAMLYP